MRYPKYPSFDSKGANREDNCVWIRLTPKKIDPVLSQSTKTIKGTPIGETFEFLAPMEFSMPLTHSWEPIENIQAVFGQKIAATANKIQQGTSVFKVGTPLMWNSTTPREFSFVFNLISTAKDPYYDIIYPIDKLMEYSCPSTPNDIIAAKVELPYMFKIESFGQGGRKFLNVETAALTAVQPTYSQPYRKGVPSKADVTLSFKDISPTGKGSIRKINHTGGSTAVGE